MSTKPPLPYYAGLPVAAISQNGYGLPVIDETECIECGKCAKYCPMRAVERKN